MKKLGKRMMAMTLASVLALTPITAFAADVTDEANATGNVTSDGKIEDFIEKEIFCVTLPTATANTFKFTLDPQNLLKETDATNYTTDATLLFDTKTNTSTEAEVVSKSSMKVDVTIDAEVSGLASADGAEKPYAIKMAAKDAVSTGTDTNMYIGLILGSNDALAVSDSTKKVSASTTLDPVAADKFEITKGNDGKYSYALKSDAAAADFKTVKFKFEGACNKNANWTNAKTATPSLKVTWTLKKHSDNVAATFTASDDVGKINYTEGSGTGALTSITSIILPNNGTDYDGYNALDGYWAAATKNNGVITFDSDFLAYYSAVETVTATVNYKVGTEDKTATVIVKTK